MTLEVTEAKTAISCALTLSESMASYAWTRRCGSCVSAIRRLQTSANSGRHGKLTLKTVRRRGRRTLNRMRQGAASDGLRS